MQGSADILHTAADGMGNRTFAAVVQAGQALALHLGTFFVQSSWGQMQDSDLVLAHM